MQNESSDELAEAVARAVLAKFAELPKNGKPSPTEWTILAGLAASRPAGGGEEVAVVALATGSKCLGAGKLRPDGRALHDSHAEVLARRSLVHFLQTQLLLLSELGEAAAANDDCILQWAPGPSTRHTLHRQFTDCHLIYQQPPSTCLGRCWQIATRQWRSGRRNERKPALDAFFRLVFSGTRAARAARHTQLNLQKPKGID